MISNKTWEVTRNNWVIGMSKIFAKVRGEILQNLKNPKKPNPQTQQ